MMPRILIFTLVVVLSSACRNRAQSTLHDMESLGLESLEGKIPAYYSHGFEDRARETADLLQNSTAYFEENFQVSQAYSLAVLDSTDWIRITSIPYGLPFVSGPPYIVCIPASSEHVLARMVSDGMGKTGLHESYGMSLEAFTNRFVSLIGFHELGHIYARDFGMRFPNKWTEEFAASYFAYCYLRDEHPAMGHLWLEASGILVKGPGPQYRSISDFEDLYVKVGVENYAWYQMVFLLRVGEVYSQGGKGFLEILRKHSWSDASSGHHLHDMEGLIPGFEAWAAAHGLVE
jgi:hypothetical protein